jgi:hypothetical protein
MADAYIQTVPDGQGKKIQTVENTIGADSVHAEAVYIVGTDGVSNYTTDRKLRMSSTPYTYDIAEGNIANHLIFQRNGFVTDVDNVEEDLWPQGAKYVFPAAEMGMEVVSTTVNDDVAGTGIQKVKIYYLDDTFAEQNTEVEMDGTTPVATSVTDIYRVNYFRASQVGTGGFADGTVSLRHLADTPIYGSIAVGNTQARSLIYTVPLGKTVYLTDMSVSGSSTAGNHYTSFTLRTNWDYIPDVKVGWMNPVYTLTVQDGGLNIPFVTPIKLNATADVVMSVVSDAVNADAVCQSNIRGWIES